jgi:predicted transposase YbfD/YdcC
VLGQQATEEKSNEITAIPLLLKHLDLKGALVTMDAMGTQTEIARAIRDGGGDYCMSLKKNWPAVYADVEQLFSDPPENVAFETNETVDLTGGRIETRRHTVCHKVDWMTSDRHYPGEPVFPDLAMIGRPFFAPRRGQVVLVFRLITSRIIWPLPNQIFQTFGIITHEHSCPKLVSGRTVTQTIRGHRYAIPFPILQGIVARNHSARNMLFFMACRVADIIPGHLPGLAALSSAFPMVTPIGQG